MTTRQKATLRDYFGDIDRLAENLHNNFPGVEITNDQELRRVLQEYFTDRGVEVAGFIDRNPTNRQRLLKQILFKGARGKNLKKDQQQTSKTVLPNTDKGRKQYSKIGARKSDLDGVDTLKGRKLKPNKTKHISPRKRFTKTPSNRRVNVRPDNLNFTGKVKNKIVRAQSESVTVMGKTQQRFRDRKGRFVSVKKK